MQIVSSNPRQATSLSLFFPPKWLLPCHATFLSESVKVNSFYLNILNDDDFLSPQGTKFFNELFEIESGRKTNDEKSSCCRPCLQFEARATESQNIWWGQAYEEPPPLIFIKNFGPIPWGILKEISRESKFHFFTESYHQNM